MSAKPTHFVIRAKEGRRLRYKGGPPLTTDVTGERKPRNRFWLRQVARGDAEEVQQADPAITAELPIMEVN